MNTITLEAGQVWLRPDAVILILKVSAVSGFVNYYFSGVPSYAQTSYSITGVFVSHKETLMFEFSKWELAT